MSKNERSARQAAERRGRGAEWAALFLLLLKGYWPLAQRAKTPLGEIDLIIRGRKRLVFVEVKQRTVPQSGLEAISTHQAARIARAAEWWVARHPAFAHEETRFDLVVVSASFWPRHYPGFF